MSLVALLTTLILTRFLASSSVIARNDNIAESQLRANSTLSKDARMEIDSWESSSRHPNETQASSSYLTAVQSLVPSRYYPSGLHSSPTRSSFRSEHYQPAFASSDFEYPITQLNPEQSIGPTSKHFVVVSFIGLLLLFAIIQNTISAAKRKDALVDVLSSSRTRRDLTMVHGLNPMTPEQEDVLKDDAKVRCIQRTVCLENRKLLEDLGIVGKLLAEYLTRSVEMSLKASSGWRRLVEDAGAAGLRGENCNVLYRDCDFSTSLESRMSRER